MDAASSRNFLGCNAWLNRVMLALVDHDSELCLSAYDEI